MKPTAHGLSDVGLVRKTNEDFHLIDESLGLYVLCDGVSGHAAGNVASKLCAETIREVIAKNKALLASPVRSALVQLIEGAIQAANTRINEMAEADPAKRGMSTTVDVALFSQDFFIIGHVGDSSVFLVRNGNVHKLTEDHKVATDMRKQGTWTEQEISRSPYANVLTRAVGIQKFVQCDVLQIELSEGDMMVLCSDGLGDYLRGNELAAILSQGEFGAMPLKLVNLAKERGGKDNVTNICLRVAGDSKANVGIDALKKSDILGKVPLFRFLDYTELLKVLGIMTVKDFRPGEFLIREGTPGDEMFVIISGEVELTKSGHILARRGKGELFGEMSLFDSAPRSASIRAHDSVSVMLVKRHDIMALLRRESQICVKLLWAINQELNGRLRTTTQELIELRAAYAASEKDTDLEVPFPRPIAE